MDSGEGYHCDIEYKVNLAKRLDGDIDIIVSCSQDGLISSHLLSLDGDIGLGLEELGKVMRSDYEKNRKAKFLEWVLSEFI